MSTPKRHHYLPQVYPKKFTSNGDLWIYDRSEDKFRLDHPANIAVIKHYYSLELESGERITEIEQMLSGIEGAASPVIDKLRRGDDLSAEERQTLATFVAFLFSRVPQYDRMMAEIGDSVSKFVARFAPPEAAEETTNQMTGPQRTGLGASTDSIAEFGRSRTSTLKAMLQQAERLSRYFPRMNWIIFHTPEDRGLVTTDAPLVLIPPPDYDPSKFGSGVGMLTTGAGKIVPLARDTALLMGDAGTMLTHTQIDSELTEELNCTVASDCDRLVIGEDEDLVRDIVNKSGVDCSSPKEIVTVR